MNRVIYGERVQGASHIRSGVVCQDNFKKLEISGNVSVIAVADGHGSSSCPYSDTGSKIAVNAFCRVIGKLVEQFADDMDFLMTYLNREGDTTIAKAIDTDWKEHVWKAHRDNKREKSEDKVEVYKQYGTTLLGLLVTSKFIFALQIGDGDIVYVDAEGVQPVIEGDKILGVETHSLCKLDAWKKAVSMIRRREIEENLPYLYLMSTDGFSNSHSDQESFYHTCQEYYDLIQEHGFEVMKVNLKDWLNETSELGCGDDITVVLSYYSVDNVKETDDGN